jgi:hypothetical protein
MRPVIFAAALALSSILGGCISDPNMRDVWDAHHAVSATHELRSSPAAQQGAPRSEGPATRREALRAR